MLELRQVVYEGRNEYLLSNSPADAGATSPRYPSLSRHPAEDRFDAHSFAFHCTVGGELIAASRFTPPDQGAWEATELGPVPASIVDDGERTLQIGRVVVREDLRGRQISEVMMHFACRWLSEHTPYRRYFALCVPRLARFYEHFGAETAPGEPLTLASRRNQQYHWIHGDLARSAAIIASFLEQRADDDSRAWRLGASIAPRPIAPAV